MHMSSKYSLINLSETGWIDSPLEQRLRGIAALGGRSSPVVCLPDVHLKRGMEAPSSLATAFSEHVIPGLSSCSLNCGMGVVKSDIAFENVTPERIRHFYGSFRQTARSTDWDLTERELIDVAQNGFPAIAGKYGFDNGTVDRVENRGRLTALEEGEVEALLEGAPASRLNRWKVKLGLSLGGNHFVELQRISRVHDRGLAAKWGLAEGQILVMYHGGGGPLAGFMGRYFGNRTKDAPRKRAHLFVKKLQYHFAGAAGWKSLPDRLRYFSPRPFTRHRSNSEEGRRLLTSIAVGMNYGYAYRMAIASRVARALEITFGVSSKPSLVYDVSHNSIQRQRIREHDTWVHRHNACRVDADVPLPLPGMFNSASYLAVGAESADKFLLSAPHGLGELVARDVREGTASAVSSHTLRFDGVGEVHTLERHIHSPRMLMSVERMEAEGLMRRVVELTPLAVLKGFRG